MIFLLEARCFPSGQTEEIYFAHPSEAEHYAKHVFFARLFGIVSTLHVSTAQTALCMQPVE